MGKPSVQRVPSLRASPLKRWNVMKPMPGLVRTSSISFGRAITGCCAISGTAAAQASSTAMKRHEDMLWFSLDKVRGRLAPSTPEESFYPVLEVQPHAEPRGAWSGAFQALHG